ncbi:MarR family winged helix-turn-helix transcriptional regulator [uncultured Massilia sp.]|uniref:MarR family winged helix-turn-helix transcriptional regulator n=1 Tax=uncultured Massilia sp. TaxID=169973 RepID=UPI00258AAEA4|nr:MarR family transcriptional regulator [uncultured Massilia sp.]
MHAIMHLYRARQYRALRAEAGAAGEISHMETKALGYFARHPGATQRDLVQHSGRDKAQVTRLVQGLRDRGLLDARQDEQDRRSTRLYLSPLGETVFVDMHRHGQQLAGQALAGLSEAERGQLAGLLARVQANLRAQGEE